MGRNSLLILLLVCFGLEGFSQSRFALGNSKVKYLPLELSLSYQSPNYKGFRIGVENAILVRENMDVILGKPKRRKKEVLTRLDLRNLFFEEDRVNYHEVQLGFATSFRKTFYSGIHIEPILGYQFGYTYDLEDFNTYNKTHEIQFQCGIGYTRGMQRFSSTLFYFRPGFGVEVGSDLSKQTQFVLDLGVQFWIQPLRVKRWKNPWFIKKKKPNEEFEFSGRLSGSPSADNVTDKKRYKLNKKRRKYKTGRKKMKDKK